MVSLAHRLFSLLVVGLCACSGDSTKVLVVDPGSQDFGRVRRGLIRTAVFRVRNTSDRDVEMILKPNCGCLKVLERGQRTLGPGESSEFHLRLDAAAAPTDNLEGKRVDILTDHPEGNTSLPVKGEIYNVVTLEPLATRVGRLRPDTVARTHEVRAIPADEGATLEVRSVRLTPSDVYAVTHAREGAGATFTLTQKPTIRRARSGLKIYMDVDMVVTSSKGASEQVRERCLIEGYWDADTMQQGTHQQGTQGN